MLKGVSSKLIGRIAHITDKESWLYDGYGLIVHYDGEYYHISPWCTTMESALKESSLIFRRNEFKVRRKKG